MKFFICYLALVASVMSESNVDLLKSSNEQFTSKMFSLVAKENPNKNIVLSAFSVLSPLAQLSLASVGESHDEILKAINMPNDNVTKEVFTDVTKQVRSVKGIELKLANRVFVRQNAELDDQFAAVSRDVFNSDVKNLDFSNNVAAAQEINSWVEEKTNHRIKDLVSPDSLDSTTAAVLVNAIYFKGKWKKPFEKSQTTDQDFYLSKDKTVKIPTMKKTDDFKYGESKELDAKLLELPYEGDQSSLLILLPNKIDGISELIEKIKDSSTLAKAADNMYFNEVEVQMPKFKIETTTDLGSILQKMNVVKLFKPGQARLNHLVKGQSDLYVSEAIQKAFIVVDEEGAEAAAANAFGMYGASYKKTPAKLFYADRSFYFELRYNNLALFDGVVIQPTHQ